MILCLFLYVECPCKKNVKTCYKIPGVNQTDKEETGNLGTLTTVGNLQRLRLHPDKKAGMWKINIKFTQPYTLKVTGQTSPIPKWHCM